MDKLLSTNFKRVILPPIDNNLPFQSANLNLILSNKSFHNFILLRFDHRGILRKDKALSSDLQDKKLTVVVKHQLVIYVVP